MIPTKINKEPPLPIPLSVINSASHITKTEPAVKIIAEPMKNTIGDTPGRSALLV